MGRLPDDSCHLSKTCMCRWALGGEHTTQQPQKHGRYLRVCVPATPFQGEVTGGRGVVTRSIVSKDQVYASTCLLYQRIPVFRDMGIQGRS